MSEQIFSIDNLTEIFESKIRRKNTKGIDKVRPSNFENNKIYEIQKIKQRFDNLEYKFIPYLEILRTKGRNKYPRMISSSTVRDKILLTALKDYLHSVFPEIVPVKLANQYVREIKNELATKVYNYYYRTDIAQYYNTVNRKRLLKFLAVRIKDIRVLKVIRDSLYNVTLPKDESKKNWKSYYEKNGIPQGLPISNILAQIYLTYIDKAFSERRFKYYRYIDDILILSKQRPIIIKALLRLKLLIIGLKLNKSKTSSNKVTNKFSFLGYTFINDRLTLSEKQVSKFISRISGKFTWFKRGFENPESRPVWLIKNDTLFKECFINELNEKITGAKSENRKYGWMFYFVEIDDLSILYRIDNIIKNFFSAIDEFDNKPPSELKSIAKAYYDIKSLLSD